jgi:uncharacterized protein YcgL (UPF0745 family)
MTAVKPPPERVMCSVYRSPRKEGMYLYVPKRGLFEKVPKALLDHFGLPGHVMDLLLTRDRKLALADIHKVMDELRDKGYYLQMPPGSEENLLEQHRRGSAR